MIKLFRPHGGSLEATMKKRVVWNTRDQLVVILKKTFPELNSKYEFNHIKVKHYVYDERIKWDTYIVVLDGLGVLGYTNAPA